MKGKEGGKCKGKLDECRVKQGRGFTDESWRVSTAGGGMSGSGIRRVRGE